MKLIDQDVVIGGNLTVHGGHLTVKGTNKTIKTPHDALYAYDTDMRSNGAPADDGSTVAATPAWLLDTNERVKGRFTIPVGWHTTDVRFWHYNPLAGSGNVTYTFNYVLQYPIFGTLLNLAGTDIAISAISLTTQFASKYELPSVLAGIAVPSLDLFGAEVTPVMKWALTKTGGTLATVGVVSVTATRMT